MLHLVIQRILHKKWMVVSLLIGNILLIAITVSHPMYQAASKRHMLTDGFTNYLEEKNTYPMVIRTYGRVRKGTGRAETNALAEFVNNIDKLSGVPLKEKVCYLNLVTSTAKSLTLHDGLDSEQKIMIGALEGLEDHSKMLSGNMYAKSIGEDGFIEAVISQSAMIGMNLLVGEELEFPNVKDSTGAPMHVRITGVFSNSDASDIYWYDSPDYYEGTLMIDAELFRSLFTAKGSKYQFNQTYTVMLDYEEVRPENVDELITFSNDMVAAYKTVYSEIDTPAYVEVLEKFRSEENRISVTLAILQVPVIVLLCAFIFMISRQMLEMEENEIALLKSRGASKKQILAMYFMQSAILSGISFVIGIFAGILVCRILGASSAFLQFNARRVLKVELTGEVLLYGLGAVLLSMGMTLIPVFRRDKHSIVAVKRRRSRSEKPIWQKLFLDIILLGVSLYGLYNFRNQEAEMYARVLAGKSLDPLIFLASSLFILGAGMASLRLHSLIVSLIYRIGKKNWSPAVYTSFLQLIRTRNKSAFIMVFLVLTVSFGLFNTTVARTILANAEKNIDYMQGADVVVTEYWKNNVAYLQIDPNAKVTFTEPDFGKYGQIKGMQSLAKVFRTSTASVQAGSKALSCDFMGIDTKTFGETTDLDAKYLKYDFRDYLNVLSRNSNAVLLSSNFRDKQGLKVGDTVTYTLSGGYFSGTLSAKVYGFFDYWPSYNPEKITILADESVQTSDNYMIVGHLSTIQEAVGIFPYEIWIDMDGDTDGFYDFADAESLKITRLGDASQMKEDITVEPLFQGTNGILTMSFITILLICAIGYVIYWMLSIRSRELLFGIFRAMGMTRGEIIKMLACEQAFTGLFGIAFGLIVGWIASVLYVPIIQIAYSAADRALPLELITKGTDVARLIVIIFIMFAACMGVLIRQVYNMKISQALKLGED